MHSADEDLVSLEARLSRVLAWQPSANTLARLDARIVASASGRHARWWRRPVLLVAAAVTLMGAAITLTLVQQAASAVPGHKVAYDRGTVLNLSRSVEGYSIVLERAYLDPNQLVLAFSVDAGGAVGPIVARADVVDSEGRHYLEFSGADVTGETVGSGSVMAFDVPPGVTGIVHLTVSVPFFYTLRTRAPEVVPSQPLVYTFDLQVRPAKTVTVERALEVDGRSVSLRWLRFSATAVRLRLDADLSGLATDEHPNWGLDASLERPDGATEALSWAAFPPAWTGQPKSAIKDMIDSMNGSITIYQATSGTDDPTGTWTVTVHRLIGSDGKGGMTEVTGPWVFRVKVP